LANISTDMRSTHRMLPSVAISSFAMATQTASKFATRDWSFCFYSFRERPSRLGMCVTKSDRRAE